MHITEIYRHCWHIDHTLTLFIASALEHTHAGLPSSCLVRFLCVPYTQRTTPQHYTGELSHICSLEHTFHLDPQRNLEHIERIVPLLIESIMLPWLRTHGHPSLATRITPAPLISPWSLNRRHS